MKTTTSFRRLLKFKLATAVFITVSMAAFATLGDGGKKNSTQKSLLTVTPSEFSYKTFTLRSRYNFRGNNILSKPANNKYILLNTTVTYQKGNATYIVPMKRKVLLDKIKLNPAAR